MLPFLEVIAGPILKVIDKIVPDAAQRDAAKAELAKMAMDGQLKEMETQMSAILAEAQSADPWTSRARPTFLYVIYAFILWALPMGVLSVFNADAAKAIAAGANSWLHAIPEQLYTLFGIGYLGYTGGRTFEKYKAGKS